MRSLSLLSPRVNHFWRLLHQSGVHYKLHLNTLWTFAYNTTTKSNTTTKPCNETTTNIYRIMLTSKQRMVQALHGDISQGSREKILQKFRDDKFSVLVATDVAARGLDIPNVELVVHYDLPDQVEGFLHR